MSNEAVEKATKDLWDYINSLPPDRREKAIEYQRNLEAQAAVTEGGMNAVIKKELIHQTALLAETMDEMYEIAAGHVAEKAIRDIMNHKPNKE